MEEPLLPQEKEGGWVAAYSKTYRQSYFFNVLTGESRWPGENGNRVKVAIVVPFRDVHVEQKRSQHLARFVPYMTQFMERLGCDFGIYIIEQSKDNRKFNRGKLLNIGFDIAAREGCNVFIFHDVDLLPSSDLGKWYSTFPENPVHIARRWGRYSGNANYFGGIVAMNKKDYQAINGYPNNFWGWGGEDDEMHKRVTDCQLKLSAPDRGSIEDMEEMTLDQKIDFLRAHKDWKCYTKHELLREHSGWKENGLCNLRYHELESQMLNDYSFRFVVDVGLNDHWTDREQFSFQDLSA